MKQITLRTMVTFLAIVLIGYHYQIQTEQMEDFHHLFNHANQCFYKKDIANAIIYYQRAIAQNPSCAQAYFNCGLAFEQHKKIDEAISSYLHALQLNSGYTKAYTQLAHLYEHNGNQAEAKNLYRKALTLDGDNFDAHLGLAHILHDESSFDEAAFHFSQALRIRPTCTRTMLEYANSLNMNNNVDEAIALYEKIVALEPRNDTVLYNIAYSLKKNGQIERAIELYKAILERNPDYAEAHFGNGLAHLILGIFEIGWPEYEWRFKRSNNNSLLYKIDRSLLNQSLEGIKIVLRSEQGLGDTFQFIRYAKVLKDRGAFVYFLAPSPLVSLLRLCPYIDQVIAPGQEVPAHDYQLPLLSLPYLMNTTEETIPTTIPYLYADPSLEAYWKKKLAHDTNFKVGICWQGNPNYSTHFLRTAVAAKSIPLSLFEPLLTIPHVTIYSLQRVSGTDQVQTVNVTNNLIIFDEDFDKTHGRFMDTAAVIKQLDLVISVDTSIAHLAAALGTPTWILLPNPPDWRWMLDRSDSPWYPEHVRLFRQPYQGDWSSVIELVTHELIKASMKASRSTQITTEISAGELIDKITILQIKNKKIKDPEKLQHVQTELASLIHTKNRFIESSDIVESLTDRLSTVNEILWQVEDDIRDKERMKEFDDTFITLARSVYLTNDERGRIKKTLDILSNSTIIGEKSYASY